MLKVYDKQSMKYISELVGCTEGYLCKYNPALKKGIVPKVDVGYNLLIPKEYTLKFEEKRHLLSQDPYIYNPSFTPPANYEEALLASNGSNEGGETSTSNFATYAKPVEEKKLTLSEIASSISKRDPKSFANTPVQELSIEPTYETRKSASTTPASYKIIKVTDIQKKTIYHSVHKGENLSEIANKYEVSVKELREWNDLNIQSKLFVGKKLKVEKIEIIVKPQFALDTKSKADENTVSTETDNVLVHKIRKGETLLQLTRLYNCSLDDLKEWNTLKSSEVKVDQEIYVFVESNSKFKSYSYYEAKSGDTLETASIQFNIPLDVLKSLNNKEENEPLKKGEKIKIPTL